MFRALFPFSRLTTSLFLSPEQGLKQPIGNTTQKPNVLSFRTLEPALFPVGCVNRQDKGFEKALEHWQLKDPERNTRDNFVLYHPNYVKGSNSKVSKLKQNGVWNEECVRKEMKRINSKTK